MGTCISIGKTDRVVDAVQALDIRVKAMVSAAVATEPSITQVNAVMWEAWLYLGSSKALCESVMDLVVVTRYRMVDEVFAHCIKSHADDLAFVARAVTRITRAEVSSDEVETAIAIGDVAGHSPGREDVRLQTVVVTWMSLRYHRTMAWLVGDVCQNAMTLRDRLSDGTRRELIDVCRRFSRSPSKYILPESNVFHRLAFLLHPDVYLLAPVYVLETILMYTGYVNVYRLTITQDALARVLSATPMHRTLFNFLWFALTGVIRVNGVRTLCESRCRSWVAELKTSPSPPEQLVDVVSWFVHTNFNCWGPVVFRALIPDPSCFHRLLQVMKPRGKALLDGARVRAVMVHTTAWALAWCPEAKLSREDFYRLLSGYGLSRVDTSAAYEECAGCLVPTFCRAWWVYLVACRNQGLGSVAVPSFLDAILSDDRIVRRHANMDARPLWITSEYAGYVTKFI